MCCGGHRVENRVGEVQARGEVGWGGVGRGGEVTYFAGRIGSMVQMLLLSPRDSLCVLLGYLNYGTA